MAGSMKWLRYTTDQGDDFGYFCDESNAELSGGAVDLAGGASLLYALPRNVKPRYAVYSDATGTIVRNAVLCTQAIVPTTPIVDPVSGASLEIVRVRGEERRVLTGVDTGIIDGDAS